MPLFSGISDFTKCREYSTVISVNKIGGIMLDKKALGELIKLKRKEMGLRQVQVSLITCLSRNYISDIESGRYMPSVETLLKLAICLDIDLNCLKMTEIQVINCLTVCEEGRECHVSHGSQR